MNYFYGNKSDILAHHGIKGQKWGVRRFQKKDGTLTRAGRSRLQNYADAYMSNVQIGGIKRKHKAEIAVARDNMLKNFNNGPNKKVWDNFQTAMNKQGQGRLSKKDYEKHEKILHEGIGEVHSFMQNYGKTIMKDISSKTGIRITEEGESIISKYMRGYANNIENMYISDFYLNVYKYQ